MFTVHSDSIVDRFFRYVKIDTQSDPGSITQPSTAKQLDLSLLLVSELKSIGLPDAELDENGYVYATIPSNSDKNVPVHLLLCPCGYFSGLQSQ